MAKGRSACRISLYLPPARAQSFVRQHRILKALERRFQQVYIGEPSPEDTVSILRGLKARYEVHHGVRIRDEALLAAARLSSRYLPDRFLPDKAIDVSVEFVDTW
jgi:ATP-dependent Clp protease ATP-binding subunit ClpA